MSSWMILYAIGIIYFAIVIGMVIRCLSKEDMKDVAWVSLIAPIIVVFIILAVLIDIFTEKNYCFKARVLNLCRAIWFYICTFPLAMVIFLEEVSKTGVLKWRSARRDLMFCYKNKYALN
ncbi:hypothetical protein PV797_14155 [Clostridiaceae bacterium M8S5]|nr:hypothetical protein PV797_14155 [Clostridiaceae bacterium M8S5]